MDYELQKAAFFKFICVSLYKERPGKAWKNFLCFLHDDKNIADLQNRFKNEMSLRLDEYGNKFQPSLGQMDELAKELLVFLRSELPKPSEEEP